mmetsp:Transcript_13667/g.27258  ORF Transcript_13667/g.27258 Transcript_13667/m.27258 type:complete len:317 (-) Transcript_13667:65-1015(-)
MRPSPPPMPLLFLLYAAAATSLSQAFTNPPSVSRRPLTGPAGVALYGFFDDIRDVVSEAFSNDSNLSTDDKVTGSVDAAADGDEYWGAPRAAQQRRRQKFTAPAASAPVSADNLEGTEWTIDLFLTGMPARDPSSDLYGSKTNISTRDKVLGMDVPEDATCRFGVTLLGGGVCTVTAGEFTTGADGSWQTSGRYLRLCVDTAGYVRTVATRGTIADATGGMAPRGSLGAAGGKTSSTYALPAGEIVLDCTTGYGAPGEILVPAPDTGKGGLKDKGCVVSTEVRIGLLGASSKMVPVGRFAAQMVVPERMGRAGGIV